MTWRPCTNNEIDGLIEIAEGELTNGETVYWNMVKINPVKWKLSPWGDEGGGFWVVARMGKWVIYYNDIEDGFNTSEYTEEGIIENYVCSQSSLSGLIKTIVKQCCCA